MSVSCYSIISVNGLLTYMFWIKNNIAACETDWNNFIS